MRHCCITYFPAIGLQWESSMGSSETLVKIYYRLKIKSVLNRE